MKRSIELYARIGDIVNQINRISALLHSELESILSEVNHDLWLKTSDVLYSKKAELELKAVTLINKFINQNEEKNNKSCINKKNN